MKYPNNYVVWDLETTGFSFTDNKIIEIGAMIVENEEVVGTFEKLLNHGIEIPEEITKLTGISEKDLKEKGEDPRKTFLDFFEVLKSSEMNITHNGFKFDIPFLVESLRPLLKEEELIEFRKKMYSQSLDTAVLYKARKLEKQRLWNQSFGDFAKEVMNIRAYGVKFNVGIACEELGIDKSKVTQHRAIGDVELTHEIFKKIK